MKFDYYVLHGYVPEREGDASAVYGRWIEQVCLAEELGFDCAWFTEHHFHVFGGMLPNPPLLMAALAPRTTRIRLGTAVTILPFYNPVRVAEDVAMLDVLSDGRLEVGLGRGMANQYHEVLGADPATSVAKFEEQIAMLRAAWTEDPFTWKGTFYQCPEAISVMPRPVQRPHPRLWIPAARDPAHGREIGRQGMNLMTLPWYLPTFDTTRRVVEAFREGVNEGGHDEIRSEALGYMSAYVGETPEQARAEAGAAWERWRRISEDQRGAPEQFPLTYDIGVETSRAIFGDAEMCRAHVARLRDELGLDRLALRFDFGGLPQDLVLASMRRFATEVAPWFTSQ